MTPALKKRLNEMRKAAWLHALQRKHDEDKRRGRSAQSLSTYLDITLQKQGIKTDFAGSGKLLKWQSGTSVYKSSINQIEKGFPGTKALWEQGPEGSQLFAALEANYEDLWHICPLRREDFVRVVVKGDKRFSDRARAIYERDGTENLNASAYPLLYLGRYIAMWRIIWMSLHSWQEIENTLRVQLEASATQSALLDSAIDINNLKFVLTELRKVMTWNAAPVPGWMLPLQTIPATEQIPVSKISSIKN